MNREDKIQEFYDAIRADSELNAQLLKSYGGDEEAIAADLEREKATTRIIAPTEEESLAIIKENSRLDIIAEIRKRGVEFNEGDDLLTKMQEVGFNG